MANAILGGVSAEAYSHPIEFVKEHATQPGHAFRDEFAFGLDLILDGVERLRFEG